jgi:hypothetical protein
MKRLLTLALVMWGCGTGFAATATSVSQYGITWTFSQAHEVGQFANGDWWVVGPVTITALTPEYVNGFNGWEINPTSTTKQGFDKRVDSFKDSLVPGLPRTITTAVSIVKSISTDTTQATCRPCLRTAAVLTVVTAIPPDSGATVFRPPYFGVAKPYISTTSLRTDLLPSLAPVANTPTLAATAANFQRVQLDHKEGWTCRAMHPADNLPDYGSTIAGRNADGVLRLLLNDPLANRMPLLINLVQYGIDLTSMYKAANAGPATAGI